MMSVVHCKKEPYDVYIGRPSKWGNPFSHLPGKGEYQVSSRDIAIQCYLVYILQTPELMGALPELKDKTLGCWCRPETCHGDVLIYLVEQLDNECNE